MTQLRELEIGTATDAHAGGAVKGVRAYGVAAGWSMAKDATDAALAHVMAPPAQLMLPEPPSANRWWRTVVIKGQARILLSSEARAYKKSLEQLRGLNVATGPVRVRVDWYRGRKSGDLDKRIGVVFDALQGVLYENDDQVVEIIARRFEDKNNARVVVSVEQLQPALIP